MKIIYLATIIILLHSCDSYSLRGGSNWEYHTNSNTLYANQLFIESQKHIGVAVSGVDIATKLSEWLMESNETLKLEILDKYFPFYVVKLNGNTITMVNTIEIDEKHNIELSFNNQNIGYDGAEWRLKFPNIGNHELLINRQQSNKWSVTNSDSDFWGMECTIDVTLDNSKYIFTGEGEGDVISDGVQAYIKYKIVSPLTITYTEEAPNLISIENSLGYVIEINSEDSLPIDSGEIDIIEINNSDIDDEYSAIIKINELNSYTVTYRGVTEEWPIEDEYQYY